jgi:hypothetical protein
VEVRSQKFRRVEGKKGCVVPDVRETRGARGRAICAIFLKRAGFAEVRWVGMVAVFSLSVAVVLVEMAG